jgi:frataxin-like iron-binding protein CyaY
MYKTVYYVIKTTNGYFNDKKGKKISNYKPLETKFKQFANIYINRSEALKDIWICELLKLNPILEKK